MHKNVKNYISTVPRQQKQIETGNFCTYYKVSRMKSANHGAYISQNSWGYIDLTTSVGADYKRNFLRLFFLRLA